MKKSKFKYKLAVITVSDSCSKGERIDESGKFIIDKFEKIGYEIAYYKIVPDVKRLISKEIVYAVDVLKTDLVLTTGGTGFSERDVTPEATLDVIDKETPGIPEMMRMGTYKKSKFSILSRAVAGIRKKSLIINLPGSLKAVKETLEVIIPVLDHSFEMIKGIKVH